MFEKSLSDLIRGVRSNKTNTHQYILQCIDEVKDELKKPNDPDMKSTAISKLVYLHMLGYDLSWATFHVVEVMSFPTYHQKWKGYFAASQSFQQDTDVLMLCTNLIKKDLLSSQRLDSSMALSTLSCIVSPDLGRDLMPELIKLLSHSKPYIRKKTILVFHSIFSKYPDGVEFFWERLKKTLEDDDPGVVAAAVTIICELAKKKPEMYISLAPQLFYLLTASNNNWMLIKLIKMFAALTPFEPRLAKKLLPPLTELIKTTSSMSLLYECIYTVFVGGMVNPPGLNASNNSKTTGGEKLARLCVSKLKLFLEDGDQNLKYVGLVAMSKLLHLYPQLILESQDLFLRCVDDEDITIRMRALEILVGLADFDSLELIVNHLLTHLFPQSPSILFSGPTYSSSLVHLIIQMCSRNRFEKVTDFEWYVDILIKMVKVTGIDVGILIGEQLVDLCMRAKDLQRYCVEKLLPLLKEDMFIRPSLSVNSRPVLYYVGWIVSEYSGSFYRPFDILRILLAEGVENLPSATQAIYAQAVPKVFTHWGNTALRQIDGYYSRSGEENSRWLAEMTDFYKVTNWVLERVKELWCGSVDIELRERASNFFQILVRFKIKTYEASEINDDARGGIQEQGFNVHVERLKGFLRNLEIIFFSHQHLPVASGAQKQLKIPQDLHLDEWMVVGAAEVFENLSSYLQLNTFWDEYYLDEPVPQKISSRPKREKTSQNQDGQKPNIYHLNDQESLIKSGSEQVEENAFDEEPLIIPLKRRGMDSSYKLSLSSGTPTTQRKNKYQIDRSDGETPELGSITYFENVSRNNSLTGSSQLIEEHREESLKFQPRLTKYNASCDQERQKESFQGLPEPHIITNGDENVELTIISYCECDNVMTFEITVNFLLSEAKSLNFSLNLVLPNEFHLESEDFNGKTLFECTPTSPWKQSVKAEVELGNLKTLCENDYLAVLHISYSIDTITRHKLTQNLSLKISLSIVDFIARNPAPIPAEFASMLRDHHRYFSISRSLHLSVPSVYGKYNLSELRQMIFKFVVRSLKLSPVEMLDQAMTIFGVMHVGVENDNPKIAGLVTVMSGRGNDDTTSTQLNSEPNHFTLKVELKSSEPWIIELMLRKLGNDFHS